MHRVSTGENADKLNAINFKPFVITLHLLRIAMCVLIRVIGTLQITISNTSPVISYNINANNKNVITVYTIL